MKSIVEQIHEDFDIAVELLNEKAIQKLEINKIIITEKNKENAKKLNKLGFSNSKIVKEEIDTIVDTEKQINTSNGISESIACYKREFPFNKLILYPQVIEICEKYNLYLGKSGIYEGDIPEKNINEIETFDKRKDKIKGIRYVESFPLCCHNSLYYERASGCNMPYHICAPLSSFKKNDCVLIGHEIIEMKNKKPKINWKIEKEVKDPIVLYPVQLPYFSETIGFLIVSAWGPEAADNLVLNPINN